MVYYINNGRDVTALTGVALDIEKGEFVSLVVLSGGDISNSLPKCI